ncbi:MULTISPECIES: hypothetical protein [Burkholderia]|uniref:Uncharacterized protein n=1 Tax=Burkholderia paludis TaxID=1506587 RepID=A0A6P2SQC3_9BURK|nr:MULTISPECIES: hypothetical protein [Burkholderia]CAB3773954.1 hypothetical protein LMG30113_07370 [Burkholderia paludis]VWC47818.1 hypothetical protein BPA30113_07465 [Burkholderia paludis]
MGLDWNPIGRPKAGCKDEFERIFSLLVGGDASIDKEQLTNQWLGIQVSPFETIKAPQVGFDPGADAWARDRYRTIQHPTTSEAEFMRSMEGYYVIELAAPCDGIPVYSNGAFGYVELYSFRAQFLVEHCGILGDDVTAGLYKSCLARDLGVLGERIRDAATSYAQREKVSHVEHVKTVDGIEPESPESTAHILFSAARWCEYWARREHGMDAYW